MQLVHGYIDIHTHRKTGGGLYNYIVKTEAEEIPGGNFSAGIHPWHISHIGQQKKLLEQVCRLPACLAIGECGLDKDCSTPLPVQHQVFGFQCQLAVTTGKPMVLHAVKSHFDMIGIMKNNGVKKAVFHGYNNRYTILEKILENGFYVSMGAALLQPHSQASALIATVPLQYLFLETDDSEVPIEHIYAAAAEKLGTDMMKLKEQVVKNYHEWLSI